MSGIDTNTRAAIIADYQAGMRIDDICQTHHVARTTVSRIRRAAGLRRRNAVTPLPPADEIAAMIRAGTTIAMLEMDLHARHGRIRAVLIDGGYDHLTGQRLTVDTRQSIKASDAPCGLAGHEPGYRGGLPYAPVVHTGRRTYVSPLTGRPFRNDGKAWTTATEPETYREHA